MHTPRIFLASAEDVIPGGFMAIAQFMRNLFKMSCKNESRLPFKENVLPLSLMRNISINTVPELLVQSSQNLIHWFVFVTLVCLHKHKKTAGTH